MSTLLNNRSVISPLCLFQNLPSPYIIQSDNKQLLLQMFSQLYGNNVKKKINITANLCTFHLLSLNSIMYNDCTIMLLFTLDIVTVY